MGLSSSMFSGVTGLNANGNAMSVIGNNIANANTIGFKSSRSLFGDLLSSQIGGSGGTSQIGRGVGMSIVDNVVSQGTFENTETNTDLAIEGAGFFIVSDPATGNTLNNYTRAGAFRFDAAGNMINPEGYNVMGYNLDENGNTVGDLTMIRANTQSFTQAQPTSSIKVNTNLDSDSLTKPLGFDESDPAATSNFASSIQVYDSLGSTHLMTTYFTKVADQQWEWNSVVDGGELSGGTLGELNIVGNGTLNYDSSGNLLSIGSYDQAGGTLTTENIYSDPLDTSSDPVSPRPTAMTYTADSRLDWNNGAVQDQEISIDMQTSQFASPSVVVSQDQDGYGTGVLVKLSVDEKGNVIGNFSNGTPRKLMRIALAKFTNANALSKAGNNMFVESDGSGVPTIGTVGSGVGSIFTNSLEQSNVDLAEQFVKMIITQRGFSANSKTITTTDEMLAEVINLKR